ncbi:MAG: DUF1365 domain-containing protein [Steroidobacteraceae bacterium]|nr:DUF1365 domain-containing protein [Steroidobacteraceae bacterium]
MKSCLYTGTIRHRRFSPKRNDFRYRIFLTLLDLGELPQLFDRFWLWSARRPAPAWFRRADYHGEPAVPLDTAVRDLVERETGARPRGPIRLLTHLRYFGWVMNPVSFYYVYDAADTRVESIVAEITNTPWDERHAYVLRVAEAEHVGAQGLRWQFDKVFHVSPFLPMDMRYDWRFTEPGETLNVHMENSRDGAAEFDATLVLRREPITHGSLAKALAGFPLVTLKVSSMIYWQALRLWLKRTPFFTHPDKVAT